MKVLSRLKGKGARETAADAGREAARSAERGAKRGARLGAIRGVGESALKRARREQSATDRARGRLSEAGDSIKHAGESVKQGAERAKREAERARSRAQATASKINRPRRSKKKTAAAAGAVGAAGAAGAYFLDPESGKRRRHIARDRIAAVTRKGAAKIRRQVEYRKGRAAGTVEQVRSDLAPEKPAANDQQLSERVQSEVFRPADVPKESINVNVEDGIVYLRGEARTPEEHDELAEKAAKVDGVRRVENLLHLPDEPAKMKDGRERRKAKA
jgi:osmotically-inducible protein OsmY